MALIQVGDNYNMPAKIYYCDTEEDFEENFSDNDTVSPGTKVYILQKNAIKIKGEETWGDYSSGSATPSGPSGGTVVEQLPYARSNKEGF